MASREIPAGEFKAKCLALLDDVARSGSELVVTKRGRPVARVVPLESPISVRARVREGLEGSVTYLVDDDALLEPIDVEWSALR